MDTQAQKPNRIPFPELIAFTAAVMALNALAIDMMLPALGTIGDELGAARDNDRQLIIVVYVLANGFGQLLFGPLVDRFGRKNVLLWSLGAYVVGSLMSVFASTLALLLAARMFQGVATAAARVASVAIVRDQCSGRRMAEVMSLAVTIFMAAPILAPGLGQLVLFVAPWRGIFIALLLYGLIIALWTSLRIPETLAPEKRRPLNAKRIIEGYVTFARDRISFGYTMSSALCFGALFSYISASEQIFLETFEIGESFAFAFAGIAASLGVATMVNAKLVSRFGMRRLSHGALLSFVGANLLHLIVVFTIGESFLTFMSFMMIIFFTMGLIGPNATALAMEPMGDNAGAAAAANGFAGTTVAGLLGGLIAQTYDGTTTPLLIGFFLLGIGALLITLWTENGKLFSVGAEHEAKAQ